MSLTTTLMTHPAVTPVMGVCSLPDAATDAVNTIKGWFIGFLILGGPAAAMACLAGMLLGHFAHMRRVSESSQEGLIWVIAIEIVAGMITGLMTAVTTVSC